MAASSVIVLALLTTIAAQPAAYAAGPAVDLGTAAQYSVVGGQAVTNTGPSTLAAGVALSPGDAVTGFPPGIIAGPRDVANADAAQAQSDLVIAYNDAAGRTSDATVSGDLVGRTLTAGTYKSNDTLDVTGSLTLDAEGDLDAVFIFQVASALTTGSASEIRLVNSAQACNVFWQVGSSATVGTGSAFVGTVMALTSITVTTDATVDGRMLARNGQVSLDSNIFVNSACELGDDGETTASTETPTTANPTTGTEVIIPTPTEPAPPSVETPTGETPITETSTETPGTTTPVDTTTPGAPTTSAPARPGPPDRTGSPPLAFTASTPATVPALIAGLVLLVAGSLIVWRVRRPGSAQHRQE